ncbi:HupE/UreJ family protein [Amycolatopsis sp. DSM 110486]|uniref:HupE/UreJ family protein n=1 Tax=Amycolatopsis sp. DSM 110486 TaxID=2865832 RepID=UPI001C69BCC1|nr:HupE/UreJ family protein [Amycolatopsis sp. DSM 110486]QYN24571.1 HupE/UreJ family protein [Amycolatopsis sp. DSM 110486]
MPRPLRRFARLATVFAFAALTVILGTTTASAHGFSSVVYADVTSPDSGQVRAELGLEYDLLVVSAADYEHDDPLFKQGTAAFDAKDSAAQAKALEDHSAAVLKYVTERFHVSTESPCTPTKDGGFRMEQREGVPYALLDLDYRCGSADAHEVRSALFPDAEGYVRDTKTVVTYDLDLTSGSAALDAHQPSFSTQQSFGERFWEFFRLGAEHLLTGLDHILFLLALIAGSRRLREIVLAATTFTLAHSVTFVLAALGLVTVPAAIIEPLIALSIAVVAAWPLWRLWRRKVNGIEDDLTGDGHFSLDRTGWTRLAVVFCFGLCHGLGFASALGIDTAWSWTLLWSLLVFNVGIETVQLAIIAIVFPLLVLIRRRATFAPQWTTGVIAAAVSVMGLTWFVERIAAG